MKAHIFGIGHLRVFVNRECIGLNPPGFTTRFASSQCRVTEPGIDTARKLGILRLSPNAFGGVLVGDILHLTRLGFNLVGQFRTGKASSFADDHGIALHIDRVSRLGVGDLVAANHGAGATHFGVAGEVNVVVGCFHPIGRDETGRIFID